MRKKNMLKPFLICVMLSICTHSVAQSFNEYKKQALAEFEAYKRRSIEDFEAYRAKVNAEFAEFMRQAWKPVNGNPAIPEPEPEPDIPPVIVPDEDVPDVPDNDEIPFDEIVPVSPWLEPEPEPLVPVPAEPLPLQKKKTITLSFYGTDCTFMFDNSIRKHTMPSANEIAAADMWNAMQGEQYTNLIASCLKVKEELSLCDWAYYKLTEAIAEKIYGKSNETVMLNAFILSQSGYKLRLGRDNNGKLHLLISVTEDLYNYDYFMLDGTHYYLTDESNERKLYILDCVFPNEKSLRMSINSENRLSIKSTRQVSLSSKRYPDVAVKVSVNENLLQFYSDYPHAFQRENKYSHWSFYANAPISENVKDDLYPVLRKSISGKSECEAANILINFVQTAFEYMKDDDYWGYERAFFSEETLFYPYSDCEDRAILFSRLVRDLMGLKAVLLYYPGHLASAVEFTEDVQGDYLIVNNHKYVVCDATYIGMPLGHTMPDMDNSTAVVVLLE